MYTFIKDQFVLVRDTEEDRWKMAIYSGYDDVLHQYITTSTHWNHCIPLDDKTNALKGTTNPPEIIPEFAFGQHIKINGKFGLQRALWISAVGPDKHKVAIDHGAVTVVYRSEIINESWE